MDNTNENMTEDKDINKNNNGNSDDYEKICFVCRRPESRAGKMIVMPNNIYICQDCMQRTFDSINSSGINYEDMTEDDFVSAEEERANENYNNCDDE